MIQRSSAPALLLCLTALLGAAQANAKGVTRASAGFVVAQTTITGTPLRINVGADNSFQVFNTTIDSGNLGQIYPSSQLGLADMGWFVRMDNMLYAPSFNEHGTTATGSIGTTVPYGAPTVSAVSGLGTSASPFTVTVQGAIASTLSFRQTISYVNGENFFRKSFALISTDATPINARVFLGSDIFLAASDSGQPLRETTSGAPGGRTCAGIAPTYTILHIPQRTPAPTAFSATGYDDVWAQIGAGALASSVNPAACIDNGAALQWDVTVPAGGTISVSAATSFGALPGIITGTPPAASVPLPMWSSWGGMLALLSLVTVGLYQLRRQA